MSGPASAQAGGGGPVVAMLAMSSHRAPCSRAVEITLKLVLCRKQSPERLPWKLDLAAQGCPAVSDTRIHPRSKGLLARGSVVLGGAIYSSSPPRRDPSAMNGEMRSRYPEFTCSALYIFEMATNRHSHSYLGIIVMLPSIYKHEFIQYPESCF